MPTYTYTSLNGEGNANVVKNIKHNDKHLQWHFVYMGYSKDDKVVRAYVKFVNSDE